MSSPHIHKDFWLSCLFIVCNSCNDVSQSKLSPRILCLKTCGSFFTHAWCSEVSWLPSVTFRGWSGRRRSCLDPCYSVHVRHGGVWPKGVSPGGTSAAWQTARPGRSCTKTCMTRPMKERLVNPTSPSHCAVSPSLSSFVLCLLISISNDGKHVAMAKRSMHIEWRKHEAKLRSPLPS